MEKQPPSLQITEGGKKILNTVSAELFPVVKRMKELLIKVQKCRPFSLYSPELIELEKEYYEISAQFFTVATKLETPDILFEGFNKEKEEPMIAYFQYRGAFVQNIDEGAKYIEIIDRTLDRKNQNIQNFRTFIIAIIAVVVGIIWN
jgi:hypothetical protein